MVQKIFCKLIKQGGLCTQSVKLADLKLLKSADERFLPSFESWKSFPFQLKWGLEYRRQTSSLLIFENFEMESDLVADCTSNSPFITPNKIHVTGSVYENTVRQTDPLQATLHAVVLTSWFEGDVFRKDLGFISSWPVNFRINHLLQLAHIENLQVHKVFLHLCDVDVCLYEPKW